MYFRYISKNWIYFQIYAITMNVISTLCVLLIPESPKYLYSNKKFEKAKEMLKYIAKFNRVKVINFRFDTELTP